LLYIFFILFSTHKTSLNPATFYCMACTKSTKWAMVCVS